MSTEQELEESRERSQIMPAREFNGSSLARYTAGRRGLYRGLARKFPDLSGTLLSWALVYCLSLTTEEVIASFSDPTRALNETYAFAEANDLLEAEAIEVAGSIFKEVDAANVTPTSNDEAPPKV